MPQKTVSIATMHAANPKVVRTAKTATGAAGLLSFQASTMKDVNHKAVGIAPQKNPVISFVMFAPVQLSNHVA